MAISLRGRGKGEEIAELLSREITDSGLSCELVDSVGRRVGDAKIYTMVFEKYYMRASNRASLTVVVFEEGGDVCVDAIGSGGGQGALFRFSWGAEEDFAALVGDILSPYGFRYE